MLTADEANSSNQTSDPLPSHTRNSLGGSAANFKHVSDEDAAIAGRKAAARQKEQIEKDRASPSHEEKKAKPSRSAVPEAVESSVHYLPEAELEAQMQDLRNLSAAAHGGDTSALDELRRKLESSPHIWQMTGDLQRHSEAMMAELIGDGQPLERECFAKRLSAIRAECQSPDTSMPTQMALSRLVMCWTYAQYCELQALKNPESTHFGPLLVQAEKRLETAYRTYKLATDIDIAKRRAAVAEATANPSPLAF